MTIEAQTQLEIEMATGGRDKILSQLRRNEELGQAFNNPYAQAVYRRFVCPIAEAVAAYIGVTGPGVAARAKALLRDQDPLVLAFITVRHILTAVGEDMSATALARTIGKTIYGEVLLQQFEDINPELYFTLVNDFERRMTKSERHRLTVFKMQARQNGIDLPVWPLQDIVSVGSIMTGIARELGLLVVSPNQTRAKRSGQLIASIAPDVMGIIDQIKTFLSVSSPMTLPCIAQPAPWVTPNDGGYHTPTMRRTAPCVIRGRSGAVDSDVPELVLEAVNTLQRHRWTINGKILDAVDQVRTRFDVGDVMASADIPKPDTPEWLTPEMTKDTMTPEQLEGFARWRGEMREWYTASRTRHVSWGRFYESLRVARKYRDTVMYFVWQVDYRGRFYAMTRGVSPQGSDLQKALLMAADAKPMATPEAIRWFKIAGANRYGFDKETLDAREAWADEHHELILACAADPISNRGWTEADCPFQFLAWCFEYAEMVEAHSEGRVAMTQLPLGQDGSCNGLQHFSAALRDPVGGFATNLLPYHRPNDIYALVAAECARQVSEWVGDDPNMIAARWKMHNIGRTLTKRSVMTLPYGSTRFSCADFITSEYLRPGLAPEFESTEYNRAATWLSFKLWDSIGVVVIKAREAMEWLQQAAGEIAKRSTDPEISWRSPSGFKVRQVYTKQEVIRITTRLLGGVRVRLSINKAQQETDVRRHRNGVAPNFVHSCDAAHMHFLIGKAKEAGIDFLSMVHDDYGALAPDIPKLHSLIRETFVEMYQTTNPLKMFKESNAIGKELPEAGDLDIREVLRSDYFFS